LLDRNEAPRVDLELPGRSFDRRLGIDGLDGAGGLSLAALAVLMIGVATRSA